MLLSNLKKDMGGVMHWKHFLVKRFHDIKIDVSKKRVKGCYMTVKMAWSQFFILSPSG